MGKIKFYKSYNLSKITAYKIGGKAENFCQPSTLLQMREALNFGLREKHDIYIIGGGTNILVFDEGLKGIVIYTKKLNKCVVRNNLIFAESGISIEKLNKEIMNNSLTGMEFSSGLPGSLGGAVFMNARAYGGQISDIVRDVRVMNEKGEMKTFTNKEIQYSYKKSRFMNEKKLFIFDVVLELKKGDPKKIKQLYKKNMNDRKQKKQFRYPSVGCVFKNNYKQGISTGKIIEELKLKGTRIGGAEVSINHGNFIYNMNNAKAEDVKKLIELIEKKVYEKKGIKLEREVRLLGFN